MPPIEKVIDAPVSHVFLVFADIPRWPQIVSGIESVSLPDGLPSEGLREGTTFSETRTMFGRKVTETFRVTEVADGRLLTMQADSCGMLFTCRHTFEPVEGNRTRVTLTMDTRPTTLMARLMSPLTGLMQKSMCKKVDADLTEFKAACERSAPAPSGATA